MAPLLTPYSPPPLRVPGRVLQQLQQPHAMAARRAEQLGEEAQRARRAGRPADALALVQKALALEPSRGAWYRLQGEIYQAFGKHELARARFKRALELDGESSDAGGQPAEPVTSPPPSASLAVLDLPVPGPERMTLAQADEQVLLDGAREVLARLVKMEIAHKAMPDGDEALTLELSSIRRELAARVQRAFAASRRSAGATRSEAASSLAPAPAGGRS